MQLRHALPLAVLFCAARLAAQSPAPPPAAAPVPAASGLPLGATPAEIARFYGPVVKRNARVRHHQVLEGTAAMDGDLYGRDGLVIRALFQKGRCVLLEYIRAGAALSADDVKTLLAANAGAFTWEPGKDSTEDSKFYRRSDGRAVAHWEGGFDGSLLIASEEGDGGFAKDLMH